MVIMLRPLKKIFLLSKNEIVHVIIDTINPPIHNPEIESSIPNQRDNPTPVTTPKVQTGQIAKTFSVKRNNSDVNNNIFFIFLIRV